MMAVRNVRRRLCADRRGVAAVEFALAGPVFLLVLMGMFDYCWQFYAKSVLNGAVSVVARSSGLEDYINNPDALDAKVRAQVRTAYADAAVDFDRMAFDRYELVGKPEPFTDKNNNNRYDVGECFEDTNGNNTWDEVSGTKGSGGADDVVLYTVRMKYKRMMPVWSLLNQPQEVTLQASTVLRNQPYNSGTTLSRMVNCK